MQRFDWMPNKQMLLLSSGAFYLFIHYSDMTPLLSKNQGFSPLIFLIELLLFNRVLLLNAGLL